MNIIIFGGLGEGKTAFAVNLLNRNKNSKKRILANINLRQIPYQRVEFVEIMQNCLKNPLFFKDSILLLDEVHNLIDARLSSSAMNTDFTRFFSQVSKLNCDCILTTQVMSSQVDVRIRELGNIYIFCTKVKQDGSLAVFSERKTEEKIFIKTIWVFKLYGGLKYEIKEGLYDPSEVYDLYDTEEIILFNKNQQDKFFWRK